MKVTATHAITAAKRDPALTAATLKAVEDKVVNYEQLDGLLSDVRSILDGAPGLLTPDQTNALIRALQTTATTPNDAVRELM